MKQKRDEGGYLSNRQQYTVFNNESSSYNRLNSGVPQGSILFLIYINYITRCTTKLNFLLFADDTNIFAAGADINELENRFNTELYRVANWLKCN